MGTVPVVRRDAHSGLLLPQSWLGFQPMILVMTGVTAASTYVTMPNNPKEDSAILQIWLQARMHACTCSLPYLPACFPGSCFPSFTKRDFEGSRAASSSCQSSVKHGAFPVRARVPERTFTSCLLQLPVWLDDTFLTTCLDFLNRLIFLQRRT